jgi:hypothetical protein
MDSQRAKQIKSILPEITIDNSKSNSLETFQSNTLRPILKFQNDILITYFNNALKENKIEFNILTLSKKTLSINQLLKTNHALKQTLLGFMIGFFSNEEIEVYLDNKKEINKRLIAMIIERLCSQMEKISN